MIQSSPQSMAVLASPCTVDRVHDPQNELLDPAVQGTINVLTAAKESAVTRVVITSSISAITRVPTWPDDVINAGDCWTDVEYCKQNGFRYPLSKTIAENAAREFSKEKGLDVVVVNPSMVIDPVIPTTLNASMLMLVRLLQGCAETYQKFFMGLVHFKDVALAGILAYENPSASGRHLCVGAMSHYGDFVEKVAELYPEFNVHRLAKDSQSGFFRAKNGAKKLMDLGLEFTQLDQIIKDDVDTLKSKGFIS